MFFIMFSGYSHVTRPRYWVEIKVIFILLEKQIVTLNVYILI